MADIKNILKGPSVQLKEEKLLTYEECLEFLSNILDQLTSRFTKKYCSPIENALLENYYFIPVEFFERKNKSPVPEYKVVLIFKINRTLKKDDISFQVENESVYYPLFDSINLKYTESLIDRVLLDKFRMCKALYLHTNFESTRILNLNGETKKLYTIEDDENIFTNNRSDYYKYEGVDLNFKTQSLDDIDKLTKIIWKTLVTNDIPFPKENKEKKSESNVKKKEVKINDNKEEKNIDPSSLKMTYDKFKLLFEYGKLNMSEENIKKLWRYTNKKNNETIDYDDFVNFSILLIHCLSAWYISMYKHENNNCFDKKIKNCVEIMNLHFKEYDFENNQEISFENLKKCLLKENELFTRTEIEIILKQINPDQNFQYWKFDKILRILYYKYFNYQKLISEDKIYKYLINIFSKQDPYKTGKLHYKKMKQAFLTENKIKFEKTEILLLLNLFDINKNPEIEYYPASLILRNIVEYLLSGEIGMQKIDITQSQYIKYEHFFDEYDKYCNQIQEIFIKYDQDFDHLLNKDEFKKFITWLIPYIQPDEIEERFIWMDQDKDGVLNYQEFKNSFKELMERIRINNVMKSIKTIKEDNKEVIVEEEKKEENEYEEKKED